MAHSIILVGADKGGVGKTTISRGLLDHLERHGVPARAFDTENPRGTLHRFYPDRATIIDLGDVADQMKILDTMDSVTEKVTVIDLKAGNLSAAMNTFEKIGVLEAARDGVFNIGLLHVVGPSIASLDEMNEVAKYTSSLDYVVARNFINETNFFEWDEKTYNKYFAKLADAREIEVPKLNEMAYEQVDLAGVTFSDFVNNRTADGENGNFSFTLRGYVRRWLNDLDNELSELDMMQTIQRSKRGTSDSKSK